MQYDMTPGATQAAAGHPRLMPRRLAWRHWAGSCLLAVLLALLGCGGDDQPALTGTWTGTITDNLAGTGSVLLTMGQTGNQLTGTWQTTFPNPTNNNGGTLSGTVGGDAIALTLLAAELQDCSFTVVASRDEDNDHHFTGTYAASNCTRVENGSLDVRR